MVLPLKNVFILLTFAFANSLLSPTLPEVKKVGTLKRMLAGGTNDYHPRTKTKQNKTRKFLKSMRRVDDPRLRRRRKKKTEENQSHAFW